MATLMLGNTLLLSSLQDAPLLLHACHSPQDGMIKVNLSHLTWKTENKSESHVYAVLDEDVRVTLGAISLEQSQRAGQQDCLLPRLQKAQPFSHFLLFKAPVIVRSSSQQASSIDQFPFQQAAGVCNRQAYRSSHLPVRFLKRRPCPLKDLPLSERPASKAASLTRLAKSAPVKPVVLPAMLPTVTSSPKGNPCFLMWDCRISCLPAK